MVSFAELSPAARSVWAKSAGPSGHGLLCHMLDVATVAETILDREPASTRHWASTQFGLQEPSIVGWLSALVGLHDIGKAIPGFQAKWPPGKARLVGAGLRFHPLAVSPDRHDLASAVYIPRLLDSAISSNWRRTVARAVAAHHGHLLREFEIKAPSPKAEGLAWEEARAALFDAYWQTLGVDRAIPTVEQPSCAAAAWLSGLTSVADWIGSNVDWFPPGERGSTTQEHLREGRERALRALNDIGWPLGLSLAAPFDIGERLARILGESAPSTLPRHLQSTGDALAARAIGPTLLLVEAPMGEGKTELAFLAHLRLQAANGHRGLYVGMPTQATGNALFDRTLTFLRNTAGPEMLDIQLAHGGASLDDRVHRLRDIAASDRESVASSAWFSQRRRPLLSPYAVGTVDQALFAALNVKHHFVRMWGLANRVVVLDEVHAYDTYTGELIVALLRWLKVLGCSVILMSATLPRRQRDTLLSAWDAPPEMTVPPYPRVLACSDAGVQSEHVSCRTLPTIKLAHVAPDLAAIAESAMDSVRRGGCGAVIVNTVQRAQDLYAVLAGQPHDGIELSIFHARYPADQRTALERSVVRRFGRQAGSQRPERALLVATQVVEQSLDLDFDFMVTDLAPVDLLLQRSGRLHRHERARPAPHRVPTLTIAGLDPDTSPDLFATKWGFVYDPYLLYCTWDVLRGCSQWKLPQDIDRLVQSVYDHDPEFDEGRAAFLKTLDAALGEHLASLQDQRTRARNVALDPGAELQALAGRQRANEDGDGDGLEVVTRLGQPALSVVPVLETEGGWQVMPGDAPFDPTRPIADDVALRLVGRQLRVSRPDVVRALTVTPRPNGFDLHPWLKQLTPLVLQDGVWIGSGRSLRLDPVLGVVYGPTGPKPEAP